MILLAFLGLVGLCCLMALGNWRTTLFSAVLIAAIQDPFRKLIPGAPGYLTLGTMVIFLMGVMSLANRRPRWLIQVRQPYPRLGQATRLLGITLIPAALLSLTYGPGSWKFTLLGIAGYATPILAVAMGFHFARNEKDIRKLLAFYCAISAAMISGTFVEYYNLWPGSPIVGTEALEMNWIRYSGDFIVKLIAGFYRSPDVMGWHAAATSMLAMILAITTRGQAKITWVAVAIYAIFPLMLSGRRKMLYMLPVFVASMTWILWNFRRGSKKHVSALALILALSGLIAVSKWLGEDSTYVRYFSNEAASQTTKSLENHAYHSVVETYRQSGFLGLGLGFAAPGSHHISAARPRVWQESGPSRVFADIGVPGLIALGWLIYTLIISVWRKVQENVVRQPNINEYAAGLFSFTLANLGSLAVSGQILADSFISIFIGFMTGISLSTLRFTVPAPTQSITDTFSTGTQRIRPAL